ncbi:peptidase E [Flavobacteriales bacterium 33_180_T64]|nr:peptidase E [Flavobacteriales bacterium 33_180_T64]
MNFLKLTFLVIIFPLFLSNAHKYYVSVTQINYVKEKKSIQITSRIDISDLELTLQERFDESIKLTSIDEKSIVDEYVKTYLTQKIEIKINTQDIPFNYLGKEYDNDVVVCYLEIENIEDINTIEISNTVLLDMFPKQKNIVKTKINAKVNNLIFTKDDRNQYLNFK